MFLVTREETIATHLQELRRGTVVLASLVALERPGYGYALLETLNKAGFAVDANTLYPLLRRLERQGLLSSEWSTAESRPRKFYVTSDDGHALAAVLKDDWEALSASFDTLERGAR